MSRPQPNVPAVKPLCAVLCPAHAPLAPVLAPLGDLLSAPEHVGPPHPFDLTDYYAAEMGDDLVRTLVSFAELMPATLLPGLKHAATAIEQHLATGGRRRYNLDVGYLDTNKLVLASFKGRGDKVYLWDGVWADVTLRYTRGAFEPLPWSFPDFRAPRYHAELLTIRTRLKAQLNAEPGTGA